MNHHKETLEELQIDKKGRKEKKLERNKMNPCIDLMELHDGITEKNLELRKEGWTNEIKNFDEPPE